MAVLSPGALPARPASTATQHDPSGFAGPTTAATRRRKPDVQRIASRRVRRANVLKIDVFRGLRPLPGHPRVRRASAIVRHRPDRVRVHELGHRARDHRYHLVELLRRVDVVRTKHATLSSAAIGARRRSPSIPSTSRSDRPLVDPATARGGHLPGGVAAWTGLPRVDVDGPSSCTCSGLLRPRHVVRGHGSRGAWAAPRRLQRRALFRRPFRMVAEKYTTLQLERGRFKPSKRAHPQFAKLQKPE